MQRIETLIGKAVAHLDANAYVPDHKATLNGVTPLDIARAVDAIRAAEQTLRVAFDAS